MNSYPGPSQPTSEPGAPPMLFSLSRGVLDSRRMNTNASSADPRAASKTSEQPQRRFLSSAAPRISVDALIPHPTRTATPVVPRQRTAYSDQNDPGQETEQVFSSPSLNSPRNRAYMQPNHQRKAMSPPGPPADHTFRLSELGRPSSSQVASSRSRADSTARSHLVASLDATVIENEKLQDEKEQLNASIQRLTRDLNACRSSLDATTAQLEQAESELKTTRPSIASTRESLASKEAEVAALKDHLQDTKGALEKSVTEAEAVKEAHTQERLENERLRTSVDTAKSTMAKLFVEFRTMNDNRRELKKLYDALSGRHAELVKEAEQLRTMAKNGLDALGPMLDDENTLTRAADTKSLLVELRSEITASHEVSDLLRNKLQVQGCQLGDYQRRIRELEQEKQGAMRQMLQAQKDAMEHLKTLDAIHAQNEDLSLRLRRREADACDIMADAAATKAELKVARDEIALHQQNLESQRSELESLRVIKDEHVSRLLALQETINARDKEIVALKGDVKAAMESKADLRALLAEAKNTLAEKEAELRAKDPNEAFVARIAEVEKESAALKAALEDSQEERILFERATKSLQAETEKQVANLNTTVTELTTHNKLLQASLSKAQEELKASTITIAKYSVLENDLANARQLQAETEKKATNLHTTVAELTTHKKVLQASLASTQDELKASTVTIAKYSGLQQMYDNVMGENAELKKRLETQSLSLFQAKEEVSQLKERVATEAGAKAEWQKALDERNALIKSLEARLEKQSEATTRLQDSHSTLKERVASLQEQQRKGESLIKSNEKRADSAEKALAATEKLLADANISMQTLKEHNTALDGDLGKLRADLAAAKDQSVHDADGRVAILEKRLASMQGQVSELMKHADELPNRYKQGKLSAKEKELIRQIIGDASQVHEEENIRKDNELRRRDHTIQDLNKTNAELQSSVARLLKEKNALIGEERKSIVNPKAWISSSPERPLQDTAQGSSDQNQPQDDVHAVEKSAATTSANHDDSDYVSELTDFDEEDSVKGNPRGGPSTRMTKRARSPSGGQPEDDQNQPKKRNQRSGTAPPAASAVVPKIKLKGPAATTSKAKSKKRK